MSAASDLKRFPHDLGGDAKHFAPIDTSNKPLLHWEQQCHSLFAVLATKGILTTDELRFTVEGLTPSQYADWSYYERWSAATATLLLDKGLITHDELRLALFGPTSKNDAAVPASRFQPGDAVRVLQYHESVQWRRPHIRTPGYIYGVAGVVQDVCGTFGDPSFLSLGLEAPLVYLYRVSFQMKDIWPEHESTSNDVVSVEVYGQWLESSTETTGHAFEDALLFDHTDVGRDCAPTVDDHHHQDSHDHHHDHDHDHDHDHADHSHDPRPFVEERAVRLEGPPRPGKELHQALMRILLDRQIVSEDDVRIMMERLDTAGEQLLGASLVVQAWLVPDFRQRLLDNANEAAKELGINASNPNAPTVLSVVENTPHVHNLVVCSLCSCYPSSLLGIAPSWYRASEYRARAVREPRKVLQEFGTPLKTSTLLRVHDSTADHRYLVLPERPSGTDGWSSEELRALVTRDCMIGVTVPQIASMPKSPLVEDTTAGTLL
ncbi:nitrile hydratase [Fragilaria crotonensis]|nr:nitrile hydratase [Fragilaria crotonensis]